MPTYDNWIDDEAIKYSTDAAEQIQEWIDQGLGTPDEWDSFNVNINADDETITGIISSGGYDYAVEVDASAEDMDTWDWLFDIWDWLEDEYPDVDTDTFYE